MIYESDLKESKRLIGHTGIGAGWVLYGYHNRYTSNRSSEGSLFINYERTKVYSFDVPLTSVPVTFYRTLSNYSALSFEYKHKLWRKPLYMVSGVVGIIAWRGQQINFLDSGYNIVHKGTKHNVRMPGAGALLGIEYPFNLTWSLLVDTHWIVHMPSCEYLADRSVGAYLDHCAIMWPYFKLGVICRLNLGKRNI